jgi:cytochrome d ubiquinol oxidase subunit I
VTDPSFWHRLQFSFTIVYHYLFPQLTMGLGVFLVIFKWRALRGNADYDIATRFWSHLFGINFAFGVVTGFPMEFQFGTNWARFSNYAGGVIGQTLALEGMFAFFLESAFVYALVWGERKLGPRKHFAAAVAVCAGSWLSGYFIIATNAFMQHPIAAYQTGADGRLSLTDFWGLLLNPWALAEYAHNMTASVVTASFVVTAVGAFYALKGIHPEQARIFLRTGVGVGLAAAVVVAFPTGDHQAKLVARYQPASLAAMEGRFESGPRAALTFIGQPDVQERRIDNAIHAPMLLSILAYGTPNRSVQGLNDFDEKDWPTNIELLYYSFHVMAGLGTMFIALFALANFARYKGALERWRPLLWVLMLAFPFPYIATTAGWMTAELGRQPWLVYGLFRTADGFSDSVSSGNALFTLIGFCGLYFVLGLLYVFLILRDIDHGPTQARHGGAAVHG